MSVTLRVCDAEREVVSLEDEPSSSFTLRETLLSMVGPMLRAVARRFERDPEKCSDLQQEMLLALWLSLANLEQQVSFRTWVDSVARDIGVKHLLAQRANRRRGKPEREPWEVGPVPDPEALLVARERAAGLLALLESLPDREREAVLLELQELNLPEISAALGCSIGQARETIVRARRRLSMRMKRLEHRRDSAPPPSNERPLANSVR